MQVKLGWGFRVCDLKDFNVALLGKQIWRLFHAENSLVFRILKEMYFSNYAILDAELGHRRSYKLVEEPCWS